MESAQKKRIGLVFLLAAVLLVTNLLTGFAVYFVTRPDSGPGTEEPLTPSGIFARFAPSVCTITCQGEAGTGFLAGIRTEGGQRTLFIATNTHVVRALIQTSGSGSVTVKFYNDPETYEDAEVSVAGFDSYHDVAVVAVTDKSPALSRKIVTESVNFNPAAAGQLLLIGNMSGEGVAAFTHADAAVSDKDTAPYFAAHDRFEPLFGVSVDVNGGCSGGPVFDMRGAFVGIGKAQEFSQGLPTAGHSYAVPAAIAAPLIEKAILTEADGGGIHKADAFLISAGIADFSELGLQIEKRDGKFTVARDASPFMTNGGPFKAGDKIVSFGSVKTGEPAFTGLFGELARYANENKSVPAQLKAEYTGKRLTVTVERNGIQHTVEYENIKEIGL